ncbi:glycoside hydrolase family 76 protein [Xylariaceae sp. FL0594]|nr:glycoside hydrolase family 76 protein [Xylariaceae sp. FL0594]
MFRFTELACSDTPALGTTVSIAPKDINTNDVGYHEVSIRSGASTIAYDTMSYYTGNITNTPETIGIFPQPYYWWQAGACWGAMLDYSHYTGDTSYDDVTRQALLSQVGPQFDYMVPLYHGSEGNDDQLFWGFAVLEAAERNFAQPDDSIPPWLTLAENIWNSVAARWDDTSCGGGLRWQIFADNVNGLDYKNSVSNGGLFQMSARLARATGNETYVHWAEKVWDWSAAIGLVDKDFNVFDGASSKQECKEINTARFSYSQGIYMYGAAVLFNFTDGDATWGSRTEGLLAQASKSYFSPFSNATDVMYERACETWGVCNTDQKSFKGYLARFMGATALMMPSTLGDVKRLLEASAIGAARACSCPHGSSSGQGQDDDSACGQKWYIDACDGSTGLGQQMSALETVQALLAFTARPPFKAGEIKHVGSVATPSTTETTLPPSSTPSSGVNTLRWSFAALLAVLLIP